MLQITRAESNQKPYLIEYLGNNIYHYNYDIKEEEKVGEREVTKVYTYIPVTIIGKPDYKRCIKALIRTYISEEDEFNVINDYNSFQLGLEDNQECLDKYQEYLNLVFKIKETVYADFNVFKNSKTISSPRYQDLVKLMNLTINTMALSDEQSLEIKSLYPNWTEFIGKSLEAGIKINHNNSLYKTRQAISVVLDQDGYRPGEQGSEALYEEISESHKGTIDDPIPYNNNMELFNGKYYSQNNVTYLCTRDTGQPVYHNLSDLVGLYVEVANN